MKRLKSFLLWLLSFFPSKPSPNLPVITIQRAVADKAVAELNFVPNPAMKFPRNSLCFCDSGKKFKVCCSNDQPTLIEPTLAAKIAPHVKTIRRAAR